MTRVRRVPGWLFAVLFFGVPLLEIVVLIQVGQAIGVWWTIVLLIADSIIGAWLIKREGRRAMRALNEALANGRMPARELADGILILVGGTLMLAPGFVTDAFGMLMILPFTRPLARRALTRLLAARLVAPTYPPNMNRPNMNRPNMNGPNMNGPRPGPPGSVVEGEVIDGGGVE
jgi:UPF0716 protein FxsA